MGRSTRMGMCKICGRYGELTFEHSPPRSAYNDQSVLLHSLNYILDERYQVAGKMPVRKFNRGLGHHSLCARCNNFLGGAYGEAYLSFARQAMEYTDVIGNSQSISLPFHIRPLNVLKQIVSMGLIGSMDGADSHPELARFVLNQKLRTLPLEYSCYVYLASPRSVARYCTETVTGNIVTGAMDHILVEAALPPLGQVVVRRSDPRSTSITEANLCCINHLANYEYNVFTTVFLKVPVHTIWSPTPLDYRDGELKDKSFSGPM